MHLRPLNIRMWEEVPQIIVECILYDFFCLQCEVFLCHVRFPVFAVLAEVVDYVVGAWGEADADGEDFGEFDGGVGNSVVA